MSILITGVNGCLGHALKEVIEEGGIADGEELIYLTSKMCDLTDENLVMSTFEKIRPRLVVHLAALSGGREISKKSPALLIEKNLTMTLNLMKACAKVATERIILTSSVAAYPADLKFPAVEDDLHSGPPSGIDFAYAFAKRMMEPVARAFELQYGIKANVLIVNGIFGPKMHFDDDRAVMLAGLIKRFSKASSSEDLFVFGDGENIREYTYSFDLARAIKYFMINEVDQRVVNIGNNKGKTIREYAELVADTLNLDKAKIVFEQPVVLGKIRHDQRSSNDLFLEMSHFKYTDFNEALASTISWYLENMTTT
jgi:GDP-L-fucose synthase